MELKKLWRKNKTTIIVVLILLGIYFVFDNPVSMLQRSTNSYAGEMLDYEEGALSKSMVAGGIAPMADDSEYYPEEERKIRKTANVHTRMTMRRAIAPVAHACRQWGPKREGLIRLSS